MGSPITWYTLGRTVSDPETIMEVVDEKMLAHNEDPSAHGQTDEAVYAHRNYDTLDHPQYSIYNIKLNPATRTVKAFCDVGGAAEFEKIQDAIDYVHGAGGGKIHIKSGTYNIGTNVTLYSNIDLIGEDRTDTIIDFGGGGATFIAEGSSGSELEDINISNLTFKNGRDNNNGVLKFKYADWCTVDRCIFTANWDSGASQGLEIELDYADYFQMTRCKIHTTGGRVNMSHTCKQVQILYNEWLTCYDCVLYIDAQHGVVIGNTFGSNNILRVLDINGCEYTIFAGNEFRGEATSSATTVVRLWGASYNRFVGNYCYGSGYTDRGFSVENLSHGNTWVGNNIHQTEEAAILLNNSDMSVITGNQTEVDNGYSVDINHANVDHTVVVGNYLEGNVNDAGTNSTVANNG